LGPVVLPRFASGFVRSAAFDRSGHRQVALRLLIKDHHQWHTIWLFLRASDLSALATTREKFSTLNQLFGAS
jgi:hypothetical protein